MLVYLGVLLGQQWHIVGEWIDRFSTVIYIVCAVVAVGFIAFTVRRSLRERAEAKRKRAERPRIELLDLNGDARGGGSLDHDPSTTAENPDVTVADVTIADVDDAADEAAGERGDDSPATSGRGRGA